MPSVVDICNLALADLGDLANVSSIDPPDSSAQAVYCSRFYPIARDTMLELHDWNFNTRRALLALLGGPVGTSLETEASCAQWPYAYAAPSGMLAARAVLHKDAPDDSSASALLPYECTNPFAMPSLSGGQGLYTPQKFIVETLESGDPVIRTPQVDAMLRFTIRITDPTKFSPLFTLTTAKLLAAFLAGPIVKGVEGIQVARGKLQEALGMLPRATSSDANQRRVDFAQSIPWMVGR
jgi:hypothetical protein